MSGIKRAYSIKDFDSLIPGHGGVTDRMDCQLVMTLFTFVHYKTFIRRVPLTFDRVWDSVQHLKMEDQERMLQQLGSLVHRRRREERESQQQQQQQLEQQQEQPHQ